MRRRKKNTKIYLMLLLVFLSMGVVYSALTTSFSMSGTVKVSSAKYTINYTGSNATFSSASNTIIYGSTTTNKITPSTGYYLKSFSCTNGYTASATTGVGSTAAQTITINNNKKTTGSTCTATLSNAYTVTTTGTGVTLGAASLGITYGKTVTVSVTPSAGYYISGATCTNGYTVTNMTTGVGNTAAQTVTINNNSKTANSTCTFTGSNSYTVAMSGSNVTFGSTSLAITYGGSKTVTLTPATGYYLSSISCTNGYTVTATPAEGFYLKSFTCTNGYTTNATTGESATGSQSITISNNNNTSSASCTAVAEMPINTQWIYKYDKDNKGVKQFEVPMTGRYKLEVISGVGGRPSQRQWVAATTDNYQCAVKQTATSELGAAYFPGKVEAEFNFTQGQTLYVVPGGNGGTGYSATSDATASGCGSATKGSGGYNGGLAGTANAMSGSGGVTHIALVDGLYSDISSSSDLLISAKSGGRYSYPKSYVSDGVGSNYVNTSSSNYIGGMATTEKYTTSDYYGTAIITYLGP